MSWRTQRRGGSETKLSVYVPPVPTDEELAFAAQIGVRHAYTWLRDDQLAARAIGELKRRLAPFGITPYNAGSIRLGKSPRIHLALPGRDEDIAEFQGFIRSLGAAGVQLTTFTWEPDGVWSTGRAATRRGAGARAVDARSLGEVPSTHGRRCSEQELWDNYSYFVGRVIPVAEAEGVRLALHPNDPPLPEIAGIPCLIRSMESYRKAFRLAGSTNLGMELCTGCRLEGGEAFPRPYPYAAAAYAIGYMGALLDGLCGTGAGPA